ncbi:ubiquinone-dependent pyruvate dehydrogenase [Dinghuibacter silviterrae]|uniref:Pyruvate dehydrogenase (Quinone)/pyruvate oxidase n=1 Tax=Dinghuibacter silviterrae TaxID=1539049 RepID=A0A4R8DHT3_9BACT|nr:ubiquinone-dependent pyruvate dehydrogenase [Dinghuibacter silviterrae]TDW96686.1 pyruvate dehydrogenase (quinone)/pyruvate oxidase [Dinghuibacter silviterrae]
MKIAKMIVDTLADAGVTRLHGLVGDSANAIANEIRESKRLRWLHYRHEEAAAFAAGAEAQLTGRLAVCIGSCGPGNMHLINGLYDAHRSYAPVLAIATHIPSTEIGTGYFQETDPKALFNGCSHYCELVSSGAQMPRILQTAMQHAVGRGGVAVIVLSGDVALEEVEFPKLRHPLLLQQPVIRPSDRELSALAGLLNGHDRVTLLCGAGCRDAHDEVLALCGKLQSPVVTALRGKQYVEYDNPYDVGLTGLIGYRSGYEAMERCEVLLMLGTDFPYKDFYPSDAAIVQIDCRAENLGRRAAIRTGLVGDIRETLSALLPLVEDKKDTAHLEHCTKEYSRIRGQLDKKADPGRSDTIVYPEYLVAELSRTAADNAIFTCDVGTPTVWAARYLQMKKGRNLLGSFNHGSMAGAMPQAIGAQFCYPERQVISLSGDGGFSMLMGDLLTIRQYQLPVKIVVFNNGQLGFVALEMKVQGYPPFGTDLDNPDFAAMAEAIGIRGMSVKTPDRVTPAIAEALAHPGPVLLDVYVNPSELSMPPTVKLEQAKGFSLYMYRQILDGNIGEVVDTVKTNFLK